MTVPARVSLATLGVADVKRATVFYLALGWRLSPASVAGEVIRSTKEETFANRRAAAAKLRWAVRGAA